MEPHLLLSQSWHRVGFFHLRLDRKISKKSRVKNRKKFQNLGLGKKRKSCVLTSGNPEIPGIGFESPVKILGIRNFLWSLGIFIPRIQDFSLYRIFSKFAGVGISSEFFTLWIFRGFFILGIGIFSVG